MRSVRQTKTSRLLLAWQTGGGSNTELPPAWRMFLVAEIDGLKVTAEKI